MDICYIFYLVKWTNITLSSHVRVKLIVLDYFILLKNPYVKLLHVHNLKVDAHIMLVFFYLNVVSVRWYPSFFVHASISAPDGCSDPFRSLFGVPERRLELRFEGLDNFSIPLPSRTGDTEWTTFSEARVKERHNPTVMSLLNYPASNISRSFSAASWTDHRRSSKNRAVWVSLAAPAVLLPLQYLNLSKFILFIHSLLSTRLKFIISSKPKPSPSAKSRTFIDWRQPQVEAYPIHNFKIEDPTWRPSSCLQFSKDSRLLPVIRPLVPFFWR